MTHEDFVLRKTEVIARMACDLICSSMSTNSVEIKPGAAVQLADLIYTAADNMVASEGVSARIGLPLHD